MLSTLSNLDGDRAAVRVWIAGPEWLESDERPELIALLSPAELDRLAGFKTASRRQQHAVSRALLRLALSEENPAIPPGDWTFRLSRRGKPFVANQGPQPAISIAHTDGAVAVAVTTRPHEGIDVGIDIERIDRQANRLTAIANRYFSPAEADRMKLLPEAEMAIFFFELWTAKEAYAKCLDLPLAEVLGMEVRPAESSRVQLISFRHNNEGLAVAVAATGSSGTVEACDAGSLLVANGAAKTMRERQS